tara:strand:- start:66 stop:344 length:279 start_codon:yes stop_codon:yes gene_type:complete
MIINSFDIANIILDKKTVSLVEDKFNTATLILTADQPVRVIGWSSKINVGIEPTPFRINHPIFKNFTFKLIGHRLKRRSCSLLENLIAWNTN